ncbi:hypothetical protein [Marinobacter sp.]|uniref:AtuA-related protein n=1 Tax=Marinobacter sp. TaxID=50741 RepID=UPI003A9561F7
MSKALQNSSTDQLVTVALHTIAHARAGDKGERLSICLFAYNPDLYPFIQNQIDESKVYEHFSHRGVFEVRRFLLPKLGGMNFVIDGALEGGVNGSLNLDGHGKSLSFRLLELEVAIPSTLLNGGKSHE